MKGVVKYALVALGAFIVACFVIKPYKNTEVFVVAPTPNFSHFNTDKLLAMINDWRISQKLQPIIESQVLCDSATIRAVEVRNDWSHNGFDPKRVCREVGCELGENLARNLGSEREVLDSWLHSPNHLEVLDYPKYQYGCIAQVDGFVALHLSDINLRY